VRVESHTFSADLVRPNSWVLDLGANECHFSSFVIDRFGAKVVAAEPNAALPAPEDPRLDLRRVAIGTSSGSATLFVATDDSEASSIVARPAGVTVAEVTVETATLDELARDIEGEIDILKIDIEGAEVDVLLGVSDELLGRCRQLCVEYHDFCGLVTRDDVARADRRLRSLGFRRVRFSVLNRLDVLYVNRDVAGVTALWQMWAQLVVAPGLAVRRNLRKLRRTSFATFGRDFLGRR